MMEIAWPIYGFHVCVGFMFGLQTMDDSKVKNKLVLNIVSS